MMRPLTAILVILSPVLCVLAAQPPVAETGSSDLSIDWWVALGGTAAGHGSIYSVQGTAGEPAANLGMSPHYLIRSGFWQDFRGSSSCCAGRVGDVNGEGEYPDEVTLGDIMLLVDVKFISGDCSVLPCIEEADVNQDGGANPTCEDHVTLGDIMTLVDFLFITGSENTTLNDCL